MSSSLSNMHVQYCIGTTSHSKTKYLHHWLNLPQHSTPAQEQGTRSGKGVSFHHKNSCCLLVTISSPWWHLDKAQNFFIGQECINFLSCILLLWCGAIPPGSKVRWPDGSNIDSKLGTRRGLITPGKTRSDACMAEYQSVHLHSLVSLFSSSQVGLFWTWSRQEVHSWHLFREQVEHWTLRVVTRVLASAPVIKVTGTPLYE